MEMNTTQTRKKIKLDLKTFLGPLDEPVKPKTLRECYREAGGFPFAARAIISVQVFGEIPVGTDIRLIAVCAECNHPGDYGFDHGNSYYNTYHGACTSCVCPDTARWQLLGHKT